MTITVYSANKCMQCRFTKEMLEREGVEFSEKNVDDNETYRDDVRQLGFQTVPVTTLRNNEGELVRVVSGFDPPGLGALKGMQAEQQKKERE